MRKIIIFAVVCIGITGSLMAQRGFNQRNQGQNNMPQSPQQAMPKVESISGTIEDVIKGPCNIPEDGKALGSYLVVKINNGTNARLHLGPACVVNDLIGDIKKGQQFQAKVFQPGQFRAQDYLVQTLQVNQNIIDFHDENLTPMWASQSQSPAPQQPARRQ